MTMAGKEQHVSFLAYLARVDDATVADFDWTCKRLTLVAAWTVDDTEAALVQDIEELIDILDDSGGDGGTDGDDDDEEDEYPPVVLSCLDIHRFRHLLKCSKRALDLVRSFRLQSEARAFFFNEISNPCQISFVREGHAQDMHSDVSRDTHPGSTVVCGIFITEKVVFGSCV